jgi:SulP family sulfate permease
VHREAQITPGVVVYRLDDRLFFANANYVAGRVREAIRGAEGTTQALVFDAEALVYIDSTGLEALLDLRHRLEEKGIVMVMARMKDAVQDQLEEAAGDEFSPERCYPTVRAAVEAQIGSAASSPRRKPDRRRPS